MVILLSWGGGFDNSSSPGYAGQGAAWVFVRNGSTWSQQSKLVGIGNTGIACRGKSVSISADGNTALVSGYCNNSNQGATWVFIRNSNIWSQQAILIGTGVLSTDNPWQGYSVSISADGNTALIGGLSGNNNGQGAAWVFVRNGNIWIQQAALVGSGNIGIAYQGTSVALSADGNTAIVGGYYDNNYQGAAWVYKRDGQTWTQQAKLVGTGNVGAAYQGHSVSISADGNIVVVGGPRDNNQGAVWFFVRSGNIWNQVGNKIVGTNGNYSGQGVSVGISADGNTSISGGNGDNSNTGAAWIFSNASSVPVTLTSFKASQKSTGIQVEWNTQNETNLDSYQVEKSTNGTNFEKLGALQANGSAGYLWFDASPANGNNYYRLKMMDKDGSFKYSSIVNVKIGGIKNVFNIAGNPVKNGQLTLQLENVEKGSYTISIYNNLGQQVMSKAILHEGGSATQTLYWGTVSTGTYQLSIIGKNVKTTKTIIIE